MRLFTHKDAKVQLPGGPGMRSNHACAGFNKVGRLGKKSPPEPLREAFVAIWAPFRLPLGDPLGDFSPKFGCAN